MQQEIYRVTLQEMTDTRVSPLLYGNFIELGYGIQVEPMWSEMFFNRSFEQFLPYKAINKLWFDLYHDENDLSKGYETDWSKFDWYHSGYEHNPWFAAPGDEGSLSIADDSSFFIERSPEREVTIVTVTEGALHGDSCLQITNRETAQWGGVAQSGKLLHPGETYHFKGWLKAERGTTVSDAEVRFYPVGDWENPIAVLPLKKIGDHWAEYSTSFANESFHGRAVFFLVLPPNTTIFADCFSLMPDSAVDGWRRDVVEMSKRVNPTVIRWPGGCFASFYDWRDGIGPYHERKPRPSYFWGGLNANDVGTAELATFAQRMGAESLICVNLHHPYKEKYDHYFDANHYGLMGQTFPQFTDLEQGARDAADWVAYCNAPAESHPMAALRAKHGYPEPFAVKYWEMDNEVVRWFKPEEYAHAVTIYSRAMKAIDPTIKIGIVSYDVAYTDKLEQMLEIAGQDVDFLADRRIGETATDEMLCRMRAFNAANGTDLFYCNTEWLPYDFEPDAFNFNAREGVTTKSYLFSKWRYAMNAIRTHMMWQRKGSDVLFVNFNNFANTHSQCVLDTPKEGVYLSAAGKAFELLSRSPAAWVLEIADYRPDDRAEFQVQSAWNKDRTALVLYVFNLTHEERVAQFDLTAFARQFSHTSINRLVADSPISMNTLLQPKTIRREDTDSRQPVHDGYTIVSPAYSFTQVVISH